MSIVQRLGVMRKSTFDDRKAELKGASSRSDIIICPCRILLDQLLEFYLRKTLVFRSRACFSSCISTYKADRTAFTLSTDICDRLYYDSATTSNGKDARVDGRNVSCLWGIARNTQSRTDAECCRVSIRRSRLG